MKSIVSAVLAMLLLSSTASARVEEEVTFQEALTDWTISWALIDAAAEEASFNAFEGPTQQTFLEELDVALDKHLALVIESCATDWHRVTIVQFQNTIAFWRNLGTPSSDAYLDAIPGLNGLVNYYQTNATIACGLGG